MKPFGLTIFCDDIRHEVDGKTTYVGSYLEQLIFRGKLPAILPKLGFGVTVVTDKSLAINKLELRVIFPGDSDETPTVVVTPQLPEGGLKADEPGSKNDEAVNVLRQTFIMSPVELKSEGVIRVRVLINDEVVRAGALRIVQELPATAPTAPTS